MADPLILQWAQVPEPLTLQWAAPDEPLPPILPTAPLPTVVTVIGPPGPAGESYDHVQSSPSAEWVVNHNLGVRPAVSVLSPGGVEVLASITHASTNQLRIYFAQPQTGSAHCV